MTVIPFQCNIDLQKNVLRIGTTGTETTFLPENELPECCKLSAGPDSDFSAEEAQLKEALERSKREEGKLFFGFIYLPYWIS